MRAELTPRLVIALSIAAAFINLLPCLVAPQGGDTFFHYAMIDCYGSQFWQGDIYPRWCMNDNAGLGSAAPIFYFPLGYYIAALVYPLHHFGLDVQQIYICTLWLANMVTFLTGWRWLADIVSPKRALLGAFLLLWMPYRMEVMVFRNAYAELWVIAFMPLLFMSVRRVLTQPKPGWLGTAFSAALCLLSHIPVGATALMACGIYSLFMAGTDWKRWFLLGFGVLVGLMTASLFFIPAWHFLDTISPPDPNVPPVWFNGYIRLEHFYKYNGQSILTASAIMAAFAATWGIQAIWRKREIGNPFVRLEIYAWAAIAVVAAFLSFEISAPLVKPLGKLTSVIAPWRMRVLIMFATVFFFCVKIQWLMTLEKLKTWKMDYTVLCSLFVALGFAVITSRITGFDEESDKALKAHIVTTWEEGQMKWVDDYHLSAIYVESHYDHKDKIDHAMVTMGSGKVDVLAWDLNGIRLAATMETQGTVRLGHFYFPIWQALVDGRPAQITPEPGSGFMQIDVPAGAHTVSFYRNLWQAAPGPMNLATAASAAGLLIMLAGFVHGRRRLHGFFDMAETA